MRYTNLSIQIILIFSVIIFCSFIPELFPNFFGDWNCIGSTFVDDGIGKYHYSGCRYLPEGVHQPTTHWGYRHYIFILMGIILTSVQIHRLVTTNDK